MSIHSIIITIFFSFSTLFLKKRKALLTLFIFSTYMPSGQALNVFTISFTPLRIIILFLLLRILIKLEYKGFIFNRLDKAISIWCLTVALISIIRNPSASTIIYQAGFVYNTLGLYIILRSLITEFSTVEYLISWLPIIILPLAIALTYESISGDNIFSFLGGTHFSWIRNARFRAQGPFRHAITAGTFGAVQIPFLWFLWKTNKNNKFNVLMGLASATFITISSNSSGPLMTLVCVIGGIALWRFKDRMKYVRLSFWASLLGLILVMKAPVWFIFAKIGDIIGGGGWHRSYLIDRTIYYFNEWWLIGTDHTEHWMPYNLPVYNHADITNMFVAQAINGGLLGLALFVYVFVVCYKYIGLGLKGDLFDLQKKYIIWAMGVALFGHLSALMSVTYFDQIIVIYYFLLAAISTIIDFQNSVLSPETFSENILHVEL